MARPSSIDQLEPEIREEIGRLRGGGHTIDEILAALRELGAKDISRSALGRHVKNMEQIGAKLRHSRNIAEALVRQLGDAPASRSAQLNIELLHSVILDLNLASEDADADGLAALRGNPEGIMLLAKAIDHLTKSSKADIENQKAIEERVEARVRKETDGKLKDAMKKQGLSKDVAAQIRKQVLGLS
ncbi:MULTISPECIES: DUF3486 family protein [Acetobacter]|uniref:DUF3486 family protein n=1 Tax=Acetobacter TaxID=434 RepID=UPI001BA6D111|nr:MULTISPECIES: DUF3486 family protein [Acetobacter]MBS1016934.1 DUF3486 family protein [Acetobacter persici]MCP1270914.1 DUF3486 family protein [Acetobacter cerevisiae]MCP1278855.1 DUF3486 family protein [Acetobacter cerevisiae]